MFHESKVNKLLMEEIMDHNQIILILLIGGFIGWSVLGIVVYYVFIHTMKEMKMIREIQMDLKIVKEEIKELK
jgi:O-antigen ligase